MLNGRVDKTDRKIIKYMDVGYHIKLEVWSGTWMRPKQKYTMTTAAYVFWFFWEVVYTSSGMGKKGLNRFVAVQGSVATILLRGSNFR